jgi:hypothetical protein
MSVDNKNKIEHVGQVDSSRIMSEEIKIGEMLEELERLWKDCFSNKPAEEDAEKGDLVQLIERLDELNRWLLQKSQMGSEQIDDLESQIYPNIEKLKKFFGLKSQELDAIQKLSKEVEKERQVADLIQKIGLELETLTAREKK